MFVLFCFRVFFHHGQKVSLSRNRITIFNHTNGDKLCLQLFAKIYYSIQFPEFWSIIEERMNLSPAGLHSLKQILTLLGFKSLHSVSKLNSHADITKVELEFVKLKETDGFRQKYPSLYEENFGFGMKLDLQSIVAEIRKRKFIENVDVGQLLHQVFEQCKIVSV